MSKERRRGVVEIFWVIWCRRNNVAPDWWAVSASARQSNVGERKLVMGRAKAHIEAFGSELQDVKTDNLNGVSTPTTTPLHSIADCFL